MNREDLARDFELTPRGDFVCRGCGDVVRHHLEDAPAPSLSQLMGRARLHELICETREDNS